MKPLNFTLLATLLCLTTTASAKENEKLKVLIVDGQNLHAKWPKTTMMMRSALEDSGRFTVDVQRTRFTWRGGKLLETYALDDGKEYQDLAEPKQDPSFHPDFASYDVVLNNFGFKAAPWPEKTQAAFQAYVAGGGGLVIVHSANNCFPKWEAYNQMTGLGGWHGRNENSGPYVYLNEDQELVRDTKRGPGGDHGPRHAYPVIIRDPQHPITRGLPRAWMHNKDELYQKLRGPANQMTILATAYSDPAYEGTDRHEPIVMTIDYEDGRVFHTPMGHDDVAMACAGFQTLLVRGTEWAATGKVTLDEVPEDFPTQDQPVAREFSP